MKKAVSLFLALVLCLSLSACGNKGSKKYAGTYTSSNMFMPASATEDYRGGTLHTVEHVPGKWTLTLNKDGSGTMDFTPDHTNYAFSNKAVFDEMCHGTLTWEENGDCVDITFTYITYVDPNNSLEMTATRREDVKTYSFEMKGSQLVNVSKGPNYTKIS